jgi:hypothetical protein
MKNVIDNALVGPNDSLDIVLVGTYTKFVDQLVTNSRHTFYTFYDYPPYDNVYKITQDYLGVNLTININMVVSIDPIDEPALTQTMASNLRVPPVFIFNEIFDLPQAKKLHVGHAFAKLDIVATDKKIADDCYLYHAPINSENWDNYLYEILNNHS